MAALFLTLLVCLASLLALVHARVAAPSSSGDAVVVRGSSMLQRRRLISTSPRQACSRRSASSVAAAAAVPPYVLALRGGADKKKKKSPAPSSVGFVDLLKAAIVDVLKSLVPKSLWPKVWKKARKTSKMMSKEHLEKSFAKGDATARVQKELRSFLANPPENCKLVVGSNIRSWVLNIVGAEDTIYAGEKYKLKIVFPKDYPSKAPSVYFLKPSPKHVHVYSNGDICLNLLGRDWRPTMTAHTLVLSIMSMLASAKEKKMPQDNAAHADVEPGQQQQGWLYHDEKC